MVLDDLSFLAPHPDPSSAFTHARYDTAGEVIAEFGYSDLPLSAESARPGKNRLIAYGGGGSFWRADAWRNRFEEWTTDGNLVQVIERSAEWLGPTGEWKPFSGVLLERPHPELRYIGVTEGGLLWTTVTVADPRWEPQRPAYTSSIPTAELFDYYVEVIDTRSGTLLVSTFLDSLDDIGFGFSSSDGRLRMHLEEDNTGRARYTVVRVDVQPR